MTLAEYERIKRILFDAGFKPEYEWAQSIEPPADAVTLFREYAWVVINSGMKEQIARSIWEKVQRAMAEGRDVITVFKHAGKAEAIQLAWDLRETRFTAFQHESDVLAFCAELPWIGPITKYHLAKNLGAQVAKPDRWLVRVAEVSGESVQPMCERLARESGDRLVTVDSMIWRACNLGMWNGHSFD